MWNPQIPGDPGHYRWHYIIETVTGLIDHIIDDSFVPDGNFDFTELTIDVQTIPFVVS